MASYQEQIAELRRQRAAAEEAEAVENLIHDYQQAQELREDAAQRGDAAAWHLHDADCEEAERTWSRYYAPRPEQPKIDPQMARYLHSKKVFLDRHGQAAVRAMDLAHGYATKPRNPTTNNPDHTGMGLQAGSPQYYKAMDDLLELYAGNLGLRYDKHENVVSPNEAARISNTGVNEYNRGVKAMHAAGKNSAFESAAIWSKKVG